MFLYGAFVSEESEPPPIAFWRLVVCANCLSAAGQVRRVRRVGQRPRACERRGTVPPDAAEGRGPDLATAEAELADRRALELVAADARPARGRGRIGQDVHSCA